MLLVQCVTFGLQKGGYGIRSELHLHSMVAFSGASSLRISMDLLPWEVLNHRNGIG